MVLWFFKFLIQYGAAWNFIDHKLPNESLKKKKYKHFYKFDTFSELKWKENSALRKPAVGSSIFGNNSEDWDSSYATDGLVQNRCPKIFHSNFEPSPWIKVDLMNALTISFIRVFNRADALGIYNIYHMYLLSSCIDISEFLWKEIQILNNSLYKRTDLIDTFFSFPETWFFKYQLLSILQIATCNTMELFNFRFYIFFLLKPD